MIACFFSEAFFFGGGAADTFDFVLEPRVEAMGRPVAVLEPEEAALEP